MYRNLVRTTRPLPQSAAPAGTLTRLPPHGKPHDALAQVEPWSDRSTQALVSAGPADLGYARKTERGAAESPGGLVRRPKLVARLRSAPLAVLAAPAGYGKSTLLAEWAQHDERPFLWVKLHRHDEFAVVAQSIAHAFHGRDWPEPDIPFSSHGSVEDDASITLAQNMQAVGGRGRGFVLVLDDAHVVRPTVLAAVVNGLLEHLTPGSQLALASRMEPPLPLGRLRAHRTLIEMRAHDLTMSPEEAASLLRMAGLELELEAVRTLTRRTEGWPAGLYLAALSLREQSDVDAGVRSFAGDDHLISEYVDEEFLAGLASDPKRFLLRTSVLDHLSGPLCDAMLSREGSALELAQLAQSTLMLVPLDANRERYRWRAPFRDALQAELRRTEPRLATRLHDRASTWHERIGDLDRAIDHAVAAGNVERTGDLLWANILRYLMHGRSDTVQGWLKRFSSDQIADYAPLALAAAHCSLATGGLDQARHWSLLAADAQNRGRAAKATESLSVGMAIIEAAATRISAVEMAAIAKRAYESEPKHSPWRSICCLLRGTAEHLGGDCQSAPRQLEEGLQLSAISAPCITALCLAQLVIIAIDQEDWETATELAERARSVTEQPGLVEYPISAIVFAVSAVTRAHQRRADEAKLDSRHAVKLLAELGEFIPWYGVQTRLLLARAALGLADSVGARTLLADASRLARRTPDVVTFQRCFDSAWAQLDTLAETALSGPSSLTIAELRILRFLPSHRSFREIAERLDVSVNTVKTQAHAIYRKLDATSRSEAVARASDAGLLGS